MREEEKLIKKFADLKKNPYKNKDELIELFIKIFHCNYIFGLKVWVKLIRDNLDEIGEVFKNDKFYTNNIAYLYVREFEHHICKSEAFIDAIPKFVLNDFLLDVLYIKSPLDSYDSVYNVVAYLIGHEKFDGANKVLTAIYSNKKFNHFLEFWKDVFNCFKDEDGNKSSLCADISGKLNKNQYDFCIDWINKIGEKIQTELTLMYLKEIY